MKWLVLFLLGIPSAYAGGITPSFLQAKWKVAVLVRLLWSRPLLLKITAQVILIVCKAITYKLKTVQLYHQMLLIQTRRQLMEFRLNG